MSLPLPRTLTDAAHQILTEPEPKEKIRLTYAYGTAWENGQISDIGNTLPPDRPGRPEKPRLCSPGDMPKRSAGTGKRRTALIHAIAHIELNAIDLAWDVVARFVNCDFPKAFYDDWVQVAVDEARHFEMLENRLHELGARYGDMDAHDGLWEAAQKTNHDILARMALVPMLLEARGLDTTSATVTRLHGNGDDITAAIMATIGEEEIDHVAAGVRWFEYICENRDLPPIPTFKTLVSELFRGQIKPPFNVPARTQANMARAYYEEGALETRPDEV